MSKSDPVTPYWKEMVDYMDKAWSDRKGGIRFYWDPRYFKTLRVLAGLYMPWGVASLWKTYMGLDDQYSKSSGYSFEMFLRKLPTLVDDSAWKGRARQLETQWGGEMPADVAALLRQIIPGPPK